MAQEGEVLTVKPDTLTLIPEAQMVEGENQLTSDLHEDNIVPLCSPTQ